MGILNHQLAAEAEAKEFLLYLKSQSISVSSKNALLFNYSEFRAQIKPSTEECSEKALLHALRRIKAIKYWNNQHVEWIPEIITASALQIREDEVIGERDLDRRDGCGSYKFQEVHSCRNKSYGPAKGDFTAHDVIEGEEEIVWLGSSHSEGGVTCAVDNMESSSHDARQLSMARGVKESLGYTKSETSNSNSNTYSVNQQYLLLQKLIQRKSMEEIGDSTKKNSKAQSRKHTARVKYAQVSKVKEESAPFSSEISFFPNVQSCSSSSSTNAKSDTEKGCSNFMDTSSSYKRRFNAGIRAKVDEGDIEKSSSAVYTSSVIYQGTGSRCRNSQSTSMKLPPSSRLHATNNIQDQERSISCQANSRSYAARPDCDASDMNSANKPMRRLKHVNGFAAETQNGFISESESREKMGKELHGNIGSGKNENIRNKIGNQDIGTGNIFVSRPFCSNSDRPQTMSVGETKTAMISVINNEKDFVTLKRVQMLYAKPKSAFRLTFCNTSDSIALENADIKLKTEKNLYSYASKVNIDGANSTSRLHKIPGSSKLVYSGHSSSGTPLLLEPGCCISLKLSCTAKYMGLHRAVILFDFGDNKIVRYVTLMSEDDLARKLGPREPYVKKPRVNIRMFATFYRGIPPPCPFFKKPLKMYPIPKHVRAALLKNETLPVFLHGLSMETYFDYFTSLLHVEEFQIERDIRVYDMQNAIMKFSGPDFLVLRVPGLVERRPSLIYRDAIYARPSGSNGKEYQGFVYKVQADEIFLKFSNSLHKTAAANQQFDIRFSYSRITIRRAHQALNAAKNLPENILFPFKGCSNAPNRTIHPFNLVLNQEQQIAVEGILRKSGSPPYLIYGPPGTGKTVTVVEAILQVLRHYPGARVLACAPSNSASDVLLERLIGPVQQREMLRLNAYTRPIGEVPANVYPYCYEKGSYFCCPTQEELLTYKVVISTYWSVGMLDAQEVRSGHFSHIFLDEAGQGMEPEAMVAIANLANETTVLVLAGDHHQLGPVVHSPIAEKFGLGKSFLERLSSLLLYAPVEQGEGMGRVLEYDSSVVTKLIRNYRSHPAILDLPSRLFYHNELIACAPLENRCSLCDWEELPSKNFPVLFVGIEGRDEREGTNPSWFNAQEASKVIEILKKLKKYRRSRVENKDIGIISPYNQQVKKLKRALMLENMEGIKVGSVEQFQGQEKRIIIISTVRSSKEHVEIDKHHNMGFIRNPKRFNVAITRAKALLVIVGNPHVLSQDSCWNELLQYCILHESYIGCDPPSLDGTDESCLKKLVLDGVVTINKEESLFSVREVEEMQWPDDTV